MAQNSSTISLPETGFLRLRQVLQLIPVGSTRWYQGVKSGEFPQPIKIGARTAAYRAEDIRALIERIGSQSAKIEAGHVSKRENPAR